MLCIWTIPTRAAAQNYGRSISRVYWSLTFAVRLFCFSSSSKETMYYSTLLVPALMSCCCLVAAVRAAQAPAPPAPPAPPVGCASYTILDYGISETASALGNLKVNSTSACCAACKCHYICVRVVMYRTRIHTSACAHTS